MKNAYRFLFWWMVANYLVYLVAVLAGGGLGLVFIGTDRAESPSALGIIAVLVLTGSVTGATAGLIQRKYLRRYLLWTADGWVRWSAIGGAVAGIGLLLLVFLAVLVTGSNEEISSMVAVGALPICLLAISGGQWIALKEATRSAWLWVFGNIIAGLVFTGVLAMPIPGPLPASILLRVLLAPAAQGLISAYVIMHLFAYHAYPVDDRKKRDD